MQTGMGWILHRHLAHLLSMVVEKVNIAGIAALETENYPPVVRHDGDRGDQSLANRMRPGWTTTKRSASLSPCSATRSATIVGRSARAFGARRDAVALSAAA